MRSFWYSFLYFMSVQTLIAQQSFQRKAQTSLGEQGNFMFAPAYSAAASSTAAPASWSKELQQLVEANVLSGFALISVRFEADIQSHPAPTLFLSALRGALRRSRGWCSQWWGLCSRSYQRIR